MHPFQSEHHAGQRRAERGGQACRGTGGDQIMLLHVLTAVAAQTVGTHTALPTHQSEWTAPHGRATDQTTRPTVHRRNGLAESSANASSSRISPRRWSAGCRCHGHRLLDDHPRDRQRGRHRGNRPRRNQPRGSRESAHISSGDASVPYSDAETVYDDQHPETRPMTMPAAAHLHFKWSNRGISRRISCAASLPVKPGNSLPTVSRPAN